jgi:hypothetical protein
MIARSGSSEKTVLPASFFLMILCHSMLIPACTGSPENCLYEDVLARQLRQRVP